MSDAIAVALWNRSTVFPDAAMPALVEALQIQVTRDFSPLWNIDAVLEIVGADSKPAPGRRHLVIADDSDQAGALGYHETDQGGIPTGFVFAKTDAQYGLTVSVTASHELLELLVDPWIFSTVLVADDGSAVALEVCDAVEADSLGYKIGDVLVSSFVTPAWFGNPGTRYDFGNVLKAPFSLAPGGYIGRFVPGTGWTQVTARSRRAARAGALSRRSRGGRA